MSVDLSTKPTNRLLDTAFAIANDILGNGKDGAGFIFRAYVAGHVFEGPPPSDLPIETPEDGILRLECGDALVCLRSSDLIALAVVEA